MMGPSSMTSEDLALSQSFPLPIVVHSTQLATPLRTVSLPSPGISNAYCGTKGDMRQLVETLEELAPVDKPLTAAELSGRWELVYTTVELFRASPFFQMVGSPTIGCG